MSESENYRAQASQLSSNWSFTASSTTCISSNPQFTTNCSSVASRSNFLAAARFEDAYRKYTWQTDVATGLKTALAITGAYLIGYAHPIDGKLAKRIVKSDRQCVIALEAAVQQLKRHGPLSDVLARVCGRQADGRPGYSGRVVKLSRWGDRYIYGLTPVVQLAFRIGGIGEVC